MRVPAEPRTDLEVNNPYGSVIFNLTCKVFADNTNAQPLEIKSLPTVTSDCHTKYTNPGCGLAIGTG